MFKNLKKVKMLLFVAATMVAVSCTKDNSVLIVGKWRCTSSTTKVTDLYTGSSSTRTNGAFIGRTIEFTRDGDVLIPGEPTLNYTVSDKSFTIIYPATGEEEKFDIIFLGDNTLEYASQPYINDGYKYETTNELTKIY